MNLERGKRHHVLTEEQATEYRRKGFRQFVPDLIDSRTRSLLNIKKSVKADRET